MREVGGHRDSFLTPILEQDERRFYRVSNTGFNVDIRSPSGSATILLQSFRLCQNFQPLDKSAPALKFGFTSAGVLFLPAGALACGAGSAGRIKAKHIILLARLLFSSG